MVDQDQAEEISQLRERVHQLEQLSLMPGRTMLASDDDLRRGYLALEREERRFSAYAIGQHPDLIEVWYRVLNCFDDAVRGWGSPPDDASEDLLIAHQMAMQLACVGGGTAKLILDAATAGYYTQAFMLVRHLFETWIRLEYIWSRPEMARRWFVGDDGKAPQPPGENSIHNHLRKHAERDVLPALNRVFEKLQELNKLAHPSELSFQQTVGARAGSFAVGANYDFPMAVGALHDGSAALIYLIRSMYRFGNHSPDLQEHLAHASQFKSDVMKHYAVVLEKYEQEIRSGGHWILGDPDVIRRSSVRSHSEEGTQRNDP